MAKDFGELCEDIQDAIVIERNNYGDHSVHGGDLALAVEMCLWSMGEDIGDDGQSIIRGSMPKFVAKWIDGSL